ncbi:zeta toxin family protein [Acidovorax sp. NCPPB 3859]|nr:MULTISPECIES: zeta toxin family protein [unclassified Acidovorax]MDA8451882.1 zeta toxin family protein [Acidovorax sp. GBBC 3297]MDA8461328.1 zeta toxin family protein [Acidovorax sp. GBBC 3333]MDA8466361.1 zeta toxin family protein [Acidovorax sp. GBBC 3332]MDA8471397.1 zeta toxin family protein [Acidovorax sp. GBBC 3299]WCM80028.1 zeta toxin family protein [Acidovorax sp. GBBC 712]
MSHGAADARLPARPALAQPRLRVLAGPNGSGKSTLQSELKPQWIGAFVNADEIEKTLRSSGGCLGLRELGVTGEAPAVLERIRGSFQTFGLGRRLDMPALLAGITLDSELTLRVPGPWDSYLAATLAEAVRRELRDEGRTFTFETVMSHRSKIDFMRDTRERGYRVYLYFVATDDPAINIDRVRRRVLQGGHPVPDDKVIDRYHKSIALMTEACEVAHRAYIFDNSGARHKLLAEVTDFDTLRLESSVLNPWFLGTGLWRAFS